MRNKDIVPVAGVWQIMNSQMKVYIQAGVTVAQFRVTENSMRGVQGSYKDCTASAGWWGH